MLTLLTSSLLWAGWVEGSPWLESHNCTYLQIVSTKMGIILKPPKHIKIARVWFSSPLSFCLFFSPFHVFMLYTLCDNLITLSNGSNLCHRSLLPPQAIGYFRFFFFGICFLLLKGAFFLKHHPYQRKEQRDKVLVFRGCRKPTPQARSVSCQALHLAQAEFTLTMGTCIVHAGYFSVAFLGF